MSTVMLVVFVAEQNRKRTQPTESAPAILEQYRGMYVSASVLCEKCWVQRALAGIASLLRKITFQFDQLKKRNAFVEIYKKFDTDLSLFDTSRENIQGVIDNYEKCEEKSNNLII